MSKVDPKITAPKVVPIDRVMEQYDEQAYGDAMPDPEMYPLDFYEKVTACVCAAAALMIIVVLLV